MPMRAIASKRCRAIIIEPPDKGAENRATALIRGCSDRASAPVFYVPLARRIGSISALISTVRSAGSGTSGSSSDADRHSTANRGATVNAGATDTGARDTGVTNAGMPNTSTTSATASPSTAACEAVSRNHRNAPDADDNRCSEQGNCST